MIIGNSKILFCVSVLFLFLSCKSTNSVNKVTDKALQIQKFDKDKNKLKKCHTACLPAKYVKKLKYRMLRQFKIWHNRILAKLNECYRNYADLKNTPCKPNKVVEIKKENIYVPRTINFAKYKKILEARLYTVRSLKTRVQIARKLFFLNLAEKNWTKAYDLYQMFLSTKTSHEFYDLLLAYIYFNNAEQADAKNILKKYYSDEEKKLEIKLVKFCRKIISYGIFEPKPNLLKKGSNALLYILVDNVHNVQTDNEFKVSLALRISITRKKEKFVLLDEENSNFTYKHNIPHIFLPIRLQIPYNLSYNYYYMKIEITDLNNNQSDKKLLKVRVVE
ncbi:MAG: hypothetical protein ACK4NF_05845 [Planctomycetota bacterium]